MANVVLFYDVGYTNIFSKNNDVYSEQVNNYIPSMRSLGPYRLASEVRLQGLTCQVVKNMITFSFAELENVCKKFINSDTLIVGFSTTFWSYSNELILQRLSHIIKNSKDINPKVKILLGGGAALDILEYRNLDIDAVITGYAEHTFSQYLKYLTNRQSLPMPSRFVGKTKIYDYQKEQDLFDFGNSQTVYQSSDLLSNNESLMLEVSRGCIFKCKFCAFPLNGKKKFDYIKNPDLIRDELIRNYNTWKIDTYVISDDTFNDSDEKIKELHKIFTSLPFTIKFSCYLRLDLLNANRHHIDLLLEMGLKGAFFGIETFHERAARTIGKGMIPSVAKKFLYDLKDIYWKDQVKIQIGLIAGLPYETMESYEDTISWIKNESLCLVDRITISPLTLSNPNRKNNWKSPFQEQSEKYHYQWPNNATFDWENSTQIVKNFSEAKEIANRLIVATEESKRNCYGYGGFGMCINSERTLSWFEHKKTFNEQMKMNRYEYTEWFEKEKHTAAVKQTLDYKRRLLTLLD